MSSGGMRSDYAYAEMLSMMRQQGSKDNPTTLQLGIMQSADSVKIGDLILTAEDLYISDCLCNSTGSDEAVSSELEKGDLVAIQKLNDIDMYVILSKVVRIK